MLLLDPTATGPKGEEKMMHKVNLQHRRLNRNSVSRHSLIKSKRFSAFRCDYFLLHSHSLGLLQGRLTKNAR